MMSVINPNNPRPQKSESDMNQALIYYSIVSRLCYPKIESNVTIHVSHDQITINNFTMKSLPYLHERFNI